MTATSPPCEKALPTIISQFQEKESKFWNSPLVITAYGRIHETAFRPWQSDNIPRRYCTGEVMISDGKVRTVHYSIIEDGGFAGFGQGVEWCVVGLDRNWAFNPPARPPGPDRARQRATLTAPAILFLKCSFSSARLPRGLV